jgi:hypothetical protein
VLTFAKLIRQWQPRRIVITKTSICFAFVGEESQIDHVPLSEVDFVMEMKDSTDTEEQKEATVRHKMQIATIPTGYNSGRTYYIATHSKDLLDQLISKLKRYAKAERSRAEASNLFRKWQVKVRKRYESNIVQGVMAMMIGAVSTRVQPLPLPLYFNFVLIMYKRSIVM